MEQRLPQREASLLPFSAWRADTSFIQIFFRRWYHSSRKCSHASAILRLRRAAIALVTVRRSTCLLSRSLRAKVQNSRCLRRVARANRSSTRSVRRISWPAAMPAAKLPSISSCELIIASRSCSFASSSAPVAAWSFCCATFAVAAVSVGLPFSTTLVRVSVNGSRKLGEDGLNGEDGLRAEDGLLAS